MKRFISLCILLSVLLLCWGCGSKEEPWQSAAPAIQYENSVAYYTQAGAETTMVLQFEDAVAPGSSIKILHGEEEVLEFSPEESITGLSLTSVKLKQNTPYSVLVDGKLQRHGKEVTDPIFPKPGDIPEPELPTIPIAPMGGESSGAEKPDSGLSMDSPPVGFDPSISDLPSLQPEQGSSGELSSEPLLSDKQENDNPDTKPAPPRGAAVFTLRGAVTEFASVQNAD